jgi:DNA-binding transcriptional MerR regulator
MTTVGNLAKRYGLSRSTLLYYHRIGLLRPSGHCHGDYRRYTEDDEERLKRILGLRNVGLKLEDIKTVLNNEKANDFSALLERRLLEMNDEIEALKAQQRITAMLLGIHKIDAKNDSVNKAKWVAMLMAAGFSESDMRRWHREFEEAGAKNHEAFLLALGIDAAEVADIRAWSTSD